MGFTTSYQAMVKVKMREVGSSTPVPSGMPRLGTLSSGRPVRYDPYTERMLQYMGRPTRTLFST